MHTTINPDAEIFEAIERWRAEEDLPDRDPGGAELRRQAMDLEWDIAEMVPSTIEGYHAKREAIVRFEFDEEHLFEFVFQLGHDAGRLGIDGEMPDIRAPR
jgi:hypothetical protein